MRKIGLARSVHEDKVRACWLGKNIGGTLGAPYEGQRTVHALKFYDPVPDGSAPNDDLDFQLVWLKMLEDVGVHPSLTDFADYWIRHLSSYPWNEYGFCRRNLERGLRPPISGCFDNYYIDEMGSPIRSEIWACTAPGDPQLAARMAWMDSSLDHAGGEGTFGEMFWSAVESAAFVCSDIPVLLSIGLSMVPVWSRISRVIRDVIWCHENGARWDEARQRVITNFGREQPCHAPQNHGFAVIGLLYGEDFGDKLCTAVNCGYDTDCTGATLGSFLGILGGTEGIPEEWTAPVGETIVLHRFTQGLDAPRTISDLARRTCAVAERMVSVRSDSVALAERTMLPPDLISILSRNEAALIALRRDPQSAIATVNGYDVAFHYGGEPVIRPGVQKRVGISVSRNDIPVDCAIKLRPPLGWLSRRLGTTMNQARFGLSADCPQDINEVEVTVLVGRRSLRCAFIMLGPGEAKGYPCGQNVPTCPRCHARAQSCVCSARPP